MADLGLALGLGLGLPVLLVVFTLCSFCIKNPCVRSRRCRVPAQDDSRPLNKCLFIGTHNSCHVSNLFSGWPCFPKGCGPAQWRYSHPTMIEQLEDGIRHLEVDMWWEQSCQQWVLFHHIPDPMSNGPATVREQLQLIADWAKQHQDHHPIWITFDVKGTYRKYCGLPFGLSSLECSEQSANALVEAEVLVKLLFGPTALSVGELRRGAKNVKEGVQEHGWPTLRDLRGKFIFTVRSTMDFAAEDTSVIFVKGAYNDGKLDDRACFYEESRVERAREIVEAGLICRSCLFIQDQDQAHTDPERFGALLQAEEDDWGIHYIATNCVQNVLDHEALQADPRFRASEASGSGVELRTLSSSL